MDKAKEAAQERQQRLSSDEEPPPPYSVDDGDPQQRPGPLGSGALPEKGGFAPQPRRFPQSFNLYRDPGWLQRDYHIGQHKEERLYAVKITSAFSRKPDVVLYNGPDESDGQLAAIKLGRWSRNQTAILPPLRPETAASCDEEAITTTGLTSRLHSFSIEVDLPGGSGARREPFEWRRSHNEAVKELHARSRGWKLVRTSTNIPLGPGAEAGPSATGGGEVVAVCSLYDRSLTKFFKFEFVGTGAGGALGQRWAIMAVISALGLFEAERRAEQSARAGGGGGA